MGLREGGVVVFFLSSSVLAGWRKCESKASFLGCIAFQLGASQLGRGLKFSAHVYIGARGGLVYIKAGLFGGVYFEDRGCWWWCRLPAVMLRCLFMLNTVSVLTTTVAFNRGDLINAPICRINQPRTRG